jgi:serine/threonine-protein kinase
MSGPQPGALLAGRYRLVAVIGRGGMGEVWRARDELLHRDVAVKTLGGWAARTSTSGERFRREALAVAQLNQRRVAGVFDFVESGSVAFIVMELLDGESLAQRLDREPTLPADEAAEIVAQAADGLQAAHDAGITHRDVKPANIMLTPHGVKLLDFGLAATAWDAGLTSTGMMVGTLAYLAPERAAGEPATAAGDIYALGVVLYETLAGHQPFRADNPLAVVSAKEAGTAPALPASTPPRLAAACLRALAKDPADRFPTAAAFAAAVRPRPDSAAAGHTARLAPCESTTRNLATPRRRRLGRRSVLLGILAAAALAVVLAFWPGGTPSGDPPSGTGQHTAGSETAGTPRRAAFRALLEDIARGAKSGDIHAEAAQDVARAAKELRKQVADHRTDLEAGLGDIDRRIDGHARDATITPQAAATLHGDVRAIATAAGKTP